MATTIQISSELWEILNKDKKVGEAFEDVIRRKLKLKSHESKKTGETK